MDLFRIPLALSCLLVFALVHPSLAHDSQEYLDGHNAARKEVGLVPVIWDDAVATYAQNYANKRKDCNLVHSDGPYGENIAWSSADDFTPADAVKMWVAEKADYDYKSNTCASDKVCGHYTQVVWRNTFNIGCAKVKCNNGGTFITCNYDPPGNFVGEKPY